MEEDKEFGISPLYEVIEVFMIQERLVELLASAYGIPRSLLGFEKGEDDESKKKSLVIPS